MIGNDIAFIISVSVFTFFAVMWVWKMKRIRTRLLPPAAVIAIIGIAVSAFIALLPAYLVECDNFSMRIWAVLRSVQHSIRLFVADDGFEIFRDSNGQFLVELKFINIMVYEVWVVFLFIIAPITTFTAMLSAFVRMWYILKNRLLIFRETHAFSELNERTLALAKSISERYKNRRGTGEKIKKPLIIFADIIDKNEEAHIDLVESAKELNAILFRKDMTLINFRWIFKRKINFYLISEDEQQKIRHAKYIIENYDDDKASMYLFSNSVESEFFMDKYAQVSKIFSKDELNTVKNFGKEKLEEILCVFDEALKEDPLYKTQGCFARKNEAKIERRLNVLCKKMHRHLEEAKKHIASAQEKASEECLEKAKECRLKAIRTRSLKIMGMHVNDIRFLVYQYLYDQGIELFGDACDDGKLKTIYATIVGCGKHGEEFMKALMWYCQFPGYKIDLTIIDRDENMESRYKAKYPELKMDCDFDDPCDMRYRITFKNIDVETHEFVKEVAEDAVNNRHFFVCLGDDMLNAKICRVVECERGRCGESTKITTIIRNEDFKKFVEGQGVTVIGNLKKHYSIDTFSADNSLIKEGFEEHLRWVIREWNKVEKNDKQQLPKGTSWFIGHTQNTFNFNSYNFYSSISKAIHRKLYSQNDIIIDERYKNVIKKMMTITDAEKYAEEMERKIKEEKIDDSVALETELRAIAELEHVRWNAYMRTEGWIVGKGLKKGDSKHKMHPNLVTVDELMKNNLDVLNDI